MNRLPAYLFVLCFLLWHEIAAQDKPAIQWGKVEAGDFSLPASAAVDSNASAVIIADVGSTSFEGNKNGWFSFIFKKKKRIKIVTKNGVGAGDVSIFLFTGNEKASRLEDLVATTYNLENGQVTATKLAASEVFEADRNKYYTEMKFTMPGLRQGSVIEYSYTIHSDNYSVIPSWSFQDPHYPCLWSEYEIKIPSTLNYALIKQGFHDFYIHQTVVGHQNMLVSEKLSDNGAFTAQTNDMYVSVNTSNHRWVMKDIPALNPDQAAFITTPSDYIDRIEFQLSQIYNGAETFDMANSWARFNEELLSTSAFGTPIRYNREWLDEDLKKICGSATDKKEQARKIYYFLSGQFTCSNYNDWTIRSSLNQVYKQRAGTVGEINLLLIAMLREALIPADPVLLSTRQYGKNFRYYPVYTKLNYLVCRTMIDGQTYFLDASDPDLAFGQLPGYCYNGHARVISEKDSASIYFVADSLRETSSTNVIIINDDKGNPSGGFQCTPGAQEALRIRKTIRKSGDRAYLKEIQAGFGSDFTISNMGIDSLNQVEEPLSYHYDFDFGNIKSNSVYYFDPMVGSRLRENPFKSTDRKFPVEMPSGIDELYTFSMEIPQGFIVDELPKSARVDLNGTDGLFEYLIQKTDSDIQLKCHLKINKATFEPSEYNTLREFFAFVVKKENEQIVFKKM